MIRIATYYSLDKALIVKGMLANYDIAAHVTPETGLGSIFPVPGAGSSVFGLYVDEQQAARAVDLLKRHGDN